MPTIPHVLRFPATSAGFEEGAARLRSLLEAERLGDGPRHNIELAFEEVTTNIVRHGAATAPIEVTFARGEDEVVLTFEDDGPPFDPRERANPAPPTSLDEAPIGGLGLMLVKALSTRLSYTRTPASHNHLTLAIPAR